MMPSGSWSTERTSKFNRIALYSGRIVRKSLDIINGADQIAQMLIWALACSTDNSVLPTMSYKRGMKEKTCGAQNHVRIVPFAWALHFPENVLVFHVKVDDFWQMQIPIVPSIPISITHSLRSPRSDQCHQSCATNCNGRQLPCN